jgi:hypothetical protein
MDFMAIIQIVGLIISVVIHIFIINWLNKMNSCKCSSTFPEKAYLYEWFVIMVIWLIVYNIIFIINGGNVSMPLMGLHLIFGFINIVMIIRLFMYLRKLRETKCNCGTLREVNILYYYLIVLFSILAFTMLLTLILSVFVGAAGAVGAAKAVKTASAKKNKSLK